MFSKEECTKKYKKLLQLLEQDYEEIAISIQGEMLVAYRQVLEYEKSFILNEIQSIENNY